jgi:hypothetical protein
MLLGRNNSPAGHLLNKGIEYKSYSNAQLKNVHWTRSHHSRPFAQIRVRSRPGFFQSANTMSADGESRVSPLLECACGDLPEYSKESTPWIHLTFRLNPYSPNWKERVGHALQNDY